MGEYKRWVSYIYSYERGIKSTNAGYVRIESRNGRCKMTVNIKGGVAVGDSLTMYMFYRDGADMIMVYAGEGEFYEGVCEFVAETICENLFGSGKSINEMGGVIAFSTIDRFYGTEWDDKPILIRRLIEHEEYIKKENSKIITFGNEEGEIEQYSYKPYEQLSFVDDIFDAEKEVTDDVSHYENSEMLCFEDETVEKERGYESDYEPDEKTERKRRFGFKDRNTNNQKIEMQVDKLQEKERLEVVESREKQVEHRETDLDEITMNDEKMSEQLARIFTGMPGMYPFEDDDIMECVKFEPQDIGVFPMDKWVLANNSFLLHGYYTYRHLIFARKRTENGPKCILGVPGMFRDREKFMANMFGFEKFKSIRGRKTPGYGEFGYWYMDIDMS